MDTQFAVSPDQIHIAYDACGAGPALMLLHGGGGSRMDWHEYGYVDRLKEHFTVITVDLRGHGESDKPVFPEFYATEKMGQDFLAVADACGIERFTLWGFSFGANVGRYLAAKSHRISKMIMIGNPIGPGVSGDWRQSASDFRARWTPLVRTRPEAPLEGALFEERLSPEDLEEIQHLSFPRELLPVVLAWSSAMLEWELTQPADILCPALWIFGSENPNAMQSYKECGADLTGSKVQFQIIDGFTHAQEFEEIDRMLPILLDFTQS